MNANDGTGREVGHKHALTRRGRDDESTKHTHARTFNPRYAAPELFARRLVHYAGMSFEDEKPADVYAYGVIMWEILARQVRRGASTHEAETGA